ncbi:MAG: serine/threonine-protein kinase [Kiritimatiellae bacterium]|nr:serine/threonine-protein kinase [Kiritimatiellia bacterium]
MSSVDLPGFEIIEKIGTGGMATVWRARQISLDRIVAIKILNPNFSSDQLDISRFQNEAQVAAALKHAGIVQVYDAKSVDGLYFFVMEYVSGYTVGEWIKRKGVLHEDNALLVVECVAAALKYAWDTRRLIHCDVKPDNVLVDADGSVKVSDLGLARTLSAMSRGEEESDEVLGTPYYMSPEQAQGLGDLDFHTDIYSLGAMLFHMLTGQIPFHDQDIESVMELQVTTDLPSVRDINPDVSPAAAALVERMTAKSPDDRQQDWDEVLSDVDDAKSQKAVRKFSTTDTMRLLKRRNQINSIHGKSRRPFVGTLIILFAATAAIFLMFNKFSETIQDMEARNASLAIPKEHIAKAAALPPSDPQAQWQKMLNKATQWAASNPSNYDDAMTRFRDIALACPDEDIVDMAKQNIDEIEQARTLARDDVMRTLDTQVQLLLEAKDYDEAANLYALYVGPFAQATKHAREQMAASYRSKVLEVPTKAPVVVNGEDVLGDVAEHLLKGEYDTAVRSLYDHLRDLPQRGEAERLYVAYDVLKAGVGFERVILESFHRQRGKVINVQLEGRTKAYLVRNVSKGSIHFVNADEALSADAEVLYVRLNDLTYAERLSRLPREKDEATALSCGLMALEAQANAYALRYFSETHEALAAPLVARLRKITP